MANRRDVDLEEFKYLIDSRNLNSTERSEERDAIIKAREDRFRKRSKDEIRTAQLMQLKYRMDDYLNATDCSDELSFPKFLRSYIDILYDKHKDFAADIDITAISLSHIINQHREPKDIFLYRLVLHTEQTYRNICEYRRDLWPRVYYRDKVCDLLVSVAKWEKAERKHVRGKEIEIME